MGNTSPDVRVIGAGLFGCVITRKLRSMGLNVDLVDTNRRGAGSPPAACLIKPSWVLALGRDVIDPSMDLLNELYGVQDINFKVGPTHTKVHWVDPAKILAEPRREGILLEVNEDGTVVIDDQRLDAPVTVLATGVWTNDVLPHHAKVPNLSGRAGVAFTWEGQLEEPFIVPWAPYRQLIAFNRTPNEIWVGDGTAIIPENWTQKNYEASLVRCARAIGRTDLPKGMHFGVRPYVKHVKPCFLKEVLPSVWVATGGAKNGTLAAGWCAHQLSLVADQQKRI